MLTRYPNSIKETSEELNSESSQGLKIMIIFILTTITIMIIIMYLWDPGKFKIQFLNLCNEGTDTCSGLFTMFI